MADGFLSFLSDKCFKRLIDENKIDQWFFIRYGDPDFHLRIRLHIPESTNDFGFVCQLINKTIAESDFNESLSKVCIDTYIRELERYGKNVIDSCESFFCYDSENTVELLSYIDVLDNDERWKMAYAKIAILLNHTLHSIEDRLTFITRLSTSYLMEFSHEDAHQDLDRMFRARKNQLSELPSVMSNLYPALMQWNMLLAELNLDWIFSDTNWEMRLQSLVHMAINRIMLVEPRKYEMILYYFLKKYYKMLQYKPIW